MSKRLDELKKEAEKARGQKISVGNKDKHIADDHLKTLKVAPKTSLQDELMSSTPKTSFTDRLKAIPTATSYSGNGFTSGMLDMDTAPHQYSTGTGVVDKIGNFAKRVDNGLAAIIAPKAAALDLTLSRPKKLYDTGKRLQPQLDKQKEFSDTIFRLKNKYKADTKGLENDPEYQQAVKGYESYQRVIDAYRNKSADMSDKNIQSYAKAQDFRTAALAGLSPTSQAIGNTAIGAGGLGLNVLAGAINPALATAMFANDAAGSAIYDSSLRGKSDKDALQSGIFHGAGTAVASALPISKLFGSTAFAGSAADLTKSGAAKIGAKYIGKNAVSGALGGTAYYGADKLADELSGDKAEFDITELLKTAGTGAALGAGSAAMKLIPDARAFNKYKTMQAEMERQMAEQVAYKQNVKSYADQQLKNKVPLLGRGEDFTVDANGVIVPYSNNGAVQDLVNYKQKVANYANQRMNNNIPLLEKGADFTVDENGTVTSIIDNANKVFSSEGNQNIDNTKEIFDTKRFKKGNFLDFDENASQVLSEREKSLVSNLIKNADFMGIEPQKMAEIMSINVNKAVEKEVAELATVMQNYKPQGVQQLLIPDLDNGRSSVLGEKFTRISNNEKWYSDLYKRTGRTPTISQIKDYAKELIQADLGKGGGEYVSNELAQSYSTVQALNDAVGKVFSGEGKVLGIEDTGDGYAVQYGRNRQEVVPDYRVRNGRQVLVNRNDNSSGISHKMEIEPVNDSSGNNPDLNLIVTGSTGASSKTSIINYPPKRNDYSAEQELFKNKYGKNTVGSAQANPDSLQSLSDKYGQIPEGENPKARVAVIPTQIDDSGKKVSEAARTFIEAGAITDETASTIEDSVLNGDYSHEVITDKEANVKALNTLKKTGFAESIDRWNSVYENGGATKYDLALAQRLMAEASQAGNSKVANQIGVQMATELTRSGQLLQANRMLKRLSPEGMVTFAETQINQLKGELADKGIDQKIIDKINLTDEDITFIYDTMQAVEGMPDGREKTVALAQVKARIENKIPSNAGNKLKTLARMSMLFNPKTQVRNVMGNAIISPISNASDVIGTAIDKAVSQKTGTRTTSLPQPSALKGMKQGIGEAVEDYRLGINTRDIEGNRFEIGQGRAFNNDTKIGKVLNGIDRTTNFMLDAGDRGFYETWFNNSLKQQMTANKVDAPTEEMIKIAKNEALKRTWQDTNNYTEKVSMFRNALNGINVKGYGLGDMTLPFIKTPANLTKALVDYSPVGVVKTLKVDADNLKTAIKTGKDVAQKQRTFVDNLSKGITGTLLMVLYSALADKGILKGEGNKDKDLANFEKNILGIQPYSAIIGDKSYSYEWAQPVGGSMAMVTDYKKAFDEADADKGKLSTTATAIWEGISASGKVLFNQSFATGIANLFGEDDIINGLMEVLMNEPAKFSPQLMSQFAQLGDDTARSTYVYGDPMATAANKVKAKTPGEREKLPPVVDVMGNEVKSNNSVFDVFFNPANYYSDVSDDAANEIYGIYNTTGDKTVIPPTAPYYVMYKNNKTVLTPEQKAEYQKTTGSIISTSVNSLIKDSDYMSLSNTAKAELLNDIYGYANATAKDKFVKGYELKAAEEKIKTAEQNGVEPFEYLLFKQAFGNIDPTDTMNGSEENKAKRELLYDNGTLSADQKALLDGMLISDGMYIPQEKNVDYSDSDSFILTQMSEAAQNKWDRAKKLGYTVEEYEQYYPVVMSGKKKAEVLGALQMQGLSYREAGELYGRMKGK